jgi:hypothetical protein
LLGRGGKTWWGKWYQNLFMVWVSFQPIAIVLKSFTLTLNSVGDGKDGIPGGVCGVGCPSAAIL